MFLMSCLTHRLRLGFYLRNLVLQEEKVEFNVTEAGGASTDHRLLLLHARDNVFVLTQNIGAGETVMIGGAAVVIARALPLGHKIARLPIRASAKIMKYAAPIGSAIADIAVGEHVHVHNIKSDYTPTYHLTDAQQRPKGQYSEAV